MFVVESFFEAVGITSVPRRIGFTTTLLEGSANAWWRLKKREIQTGEAYEFASWQDFKDSMVRFFHPAGTEQQARNTLRNLRQTGKVHSYVKVFQRALLQISHMDIGTQVDTFVHGLRDEVRQYVRTRRPQTILEAVEAAETFEDSLYENFRDARLAEAQAPRPSGPPGAEPMQLGHVMENLEINALSPHARFQPRRVTWSDRRGRSPSPRRPRSQSPGGRSPRGVRHREDKGRCHKCGRYGHWKRECPMNRESGPSTGVQKMEQEN